LIGYSVAFGARFLRRVIDGRIKLPITMLWDEGSHFRVFVGEQGVEVEALTAPGSRLNAVRRVWLQPDLSALGGVRL
jgi:hypothetical protein